MKEDRQPVRVATCGPEAAGGITHVALIMSKWISNTQRCGPASETARSHSNRIHGRKKHVNVSSAAMERNSAILQARGSPTGTCSTESQRGRPQNLGFRPLSEMISALFLRNRSQGNQSAPTRRRGQRRVDKVGCGYGCQLAVGSGWLSLPKHVTCILSVSKKKTH